MSLDRVWGSRIFLMLATATLVTATYHRRHSLSYFYDNYTDLNKLSNNVTRISDDGQQQNQHQHQHHHHHESVGGPLRVPHLRHHHGSHRGPYFENIEGHEINVSENVAHLGDTTLLDCRVAMLSGKVVMWIRQSPNRTLLTVGKSTFSADPRYSVHFKYPNNWRLAISAIQKEDRGVYVCQVNTHPPKMLVTNVTILAPDIRIVDEANHEIRDRYYKTGSVIELTCVVRPSRPNSKVPHPVWKKNGESLPDHVDVYHSNGTDNELLTRLRIEHASKSDSGEFACSIGQFSTSFVNIHVLNGEKQAAVHHDQWNLANRQYQISVVTVGMLFLRCLL
ncbi:zwei Ig domain protein zig-8-like [Phymastichus coffea]|uniref:zwei Ig domain protein zig-8-like n=1 Tax=Phymastichus coffea TaxID=108790 RepID=UPI00273AE1EC|nr:zwei Ig domain protein zig-8-like [Phymastichus coffea]XP_058794477.1 zwei Ig domain protein zig-8-like [Phymastichus coffea]XP_058794478.1 zwei Ig domain protein zig-8-like [Phymastichus coffea]XP_058794479.1 zwei Ig domain protein zig-8-like [Phymastichus coffea]XP_058794480.1 zwei Ig domain protein zig-8-like [Phymastichus coffea]